MGRDRHDQAIRTKGSASSSAYATINAVIWVVYVALVLLVIRCSRSQTRSR